MKKIMWGLLFVLSVLLVGRGIYSFFPRELREGSLMKRENPEQQVKKESQAVETENYSPTSAITRAKVLSERKSFQDEARQLFGINLWSFQEDTYLQFRKRPLANSQLDSALQNAKKVEVSVFLDDKFEVEAGYVVIDVHATDEKIIEFLSSSVTMAKAKGMELASLREEASQYGIHLGGFNTVEEYKQMRARLSSNEGLASAFRAAAREKIMIFLDSKFAVERGWVDINVSATDEEIIKFLLGK